MLEIRFSENFIQAFQHFLCEERKKRNLSQFELALKSGLSRQCLSLFESGRRTPSIFSLFALAKGFEMPAPRFMSILLNKIEFYERQDRLPMAADSKRPRWKS